MASVKEKIAYALGDAAAGGIVWKVMSIAFPLFFTNVFGLTFADAAVLMLVARMFDVVTDPLMGSLADRTQSRWGTYRPWLIFGAIPFGLIFALLLYTPDLGPTGKRVYAYTLYLLMMAVYTMVNVPYGSLLGVMTEDDNEKNQFSSFRMVGAYAMGFATLLSFPYLQKMVGGSDFFNGFRYAVAGYMFEYCLHGNVTIEGLIINYTVFMAFGEVTCMIFGGLSPVFTKTVGSKRMAFFWSALLCLVLSIAFFFIPMSPDYIWVMIALVILTSIGIGIYSPLMWSMYADVADYHTEHFGTSATGLIFSSGTMSQKFGTAISGSLIALFLGWAGANMITDKMGNTVIDPTSITDSVLMMVWSLFSLFPAVIAFLLMVLSYKFPIKK